MVFTVAAFSYSSGMIRIGFVLSLLAAFTLHSHSSPVNNIQVQDALNMLRLGDLSFLCDYICDPDDAKAKSVTEFSERSGVDARLFCWLCDDVTTTVAPTIAPNTTITTTTTVAPSSTTPASPKTLSTRTSRSSKTPTTITTGSSSASTTMTTGSSATSTTVTTGSPTTSTTVTSTTPTTTTTTTAP